MPLLFYLFRLPLGKRLGTKSGNLNSKDLLLRCLRPERRARTLLLDLWFCRGGALRLARRSRLGRYALYLRNRHFCHAKGGAPAPLNAHREGDDSSDQ